MSTTHLERQPGTTLGEYQVEERLGRGASAAVYQATGPDGRKVAVKVAGDATARKLLAAEAELTAAIDHPAIVPVLESHLDHHPPFVVQELCAGGSLRQRLASGPLPPQEVEKLILEALTGLAAAHAAGVVHRDLKPENLLFDGPGPGEGMLRIADFGLGQLPSEESLLLSEGLASQGGVAGTLDYMAPEQREGEGDHRVDLYAMGVIAFELLTGARPDRNDRLDDFVILPEAQLERWERFYSGCCARLERRFPDAATAVACLIPDLPAAPPTASERATVPPPSLVPGSWVLAAVIAIILGLLAGFVVAGGSGTSDVGGADSGPDVVRPDRPQPIRYWMAESQCRALELEVLKGVGHARARGLDRLDPALAVAVLLNATQRIDLDDTDTHVRFDEIIREVELLTSERAAPAYDPADHLASGITARRVTREQWFVHWPRISAQLRTRGR